MQLPRRAILFLLAVSVALPVPAATLADIIDAELARQFPAKLPGAAVLVIKDGVTVLNKGDGLASVELAVPVQPQHLFYVASVSACPTVTACARTPWPVGLTCRAMATPMASMPKSCTCRPPG